MALTKTVKLIIIISSVIVGTVAIVTPTTLYFINNQTETINFTLLYNAGVMIEVDDIRIYIDPIELPYSTYYNLKADLILITHDHSDHYQESTINFLVKDDTLCVFPEIMSSAIATYDGMGVNPGDSFLLGDINITCFYMYTFAPEGYEPSHPPEANYTSYIINIDGFTFFHAGDSANLFEYFQIRDTIDVALLPLGPGCQTMADMDVVYAINRIKPDYMIPIHYAEGTDIQFCAVYGNAISNCGCELIHLAYFESVQFNVTIS